jgi:hypothetical protein
MTDTRRQALLLALAAARGYLRGLLRGPDATHPGARALPVDEVHRRASAAHEAVGVLLAVGAAGRGVPGALAWAALRAVWAAGRLYQAAQSAQPEPPDLRRRR